MTVHRIAVLDAHQDEDPAGAPVRGTLIGAVEAIGDAGRRLWPARVRVLGSHGR